MTEFGDTRTITQEYRIRPCEVCGENATHRLTYLLPNARTNPASRGYGRDELTWCADAERIVCATHAENPRSSAPAGTEWCAEFNGALRPHMIGEWTTTSTEEARTGKSCSNTGSKPGD